MTRVGHDPPYAAPAICLNAWLASDASGGDIFRQKKERTTLPLILPEIPSGGPGVEYPRATAT